MTAKAPASASKAQTIASEVRRRIAEREWGQGDRIPDEAELAREFNAARATVNKALQTLAGEGFLERKRRAGTHVAINPARKATLTIPVVRGQVEAAGMAYSHRLVSRSTEPLPPDIAARMRLQQGLPLLHLRTVHYGDGKPFQAEDRWINPSAAPGAEAADFSRTSANEWLVRNFPWASADIAFSAENAGAREAKLLGTKAGTAFLILHRTTWNAAGPITSVRLAFHPGYTMFAGS